MLEIWHFHVEGAKANSLALKAVFHIPDPPGWNGSQVFLLQPQHLCPELGEDIPALQ
jgi:hypothetical protein